MIGMAENICRLFNSESMTEFDMERYTMQGFPVSYFPSNYFDSLALSHANTWPLHFALLGMILP